MAGNKFWGGDSSSSSSSDSDSDSSDEAPVQQAAQAAPRRQMTRWAEESSSDEEDNRKRVVKSSTDKRFDQMRDRIKSLKNHKKIDDFANLIVDYEALLKMLEKNKTLESEGGPPGMFIKAIADLETYCEQLHAEHQDMKQNKGTKLPENKQRAFNTLRAKVRKGNKQWADQVEKCKENPEEFDEEEEAKESEQSDSESSASGKKSSGSGSSSSDSDSDSDSDSSSSDSDSDSDSSSGSSSSSDSDSDSSSDESHSYKTGSDETDDEDVDEDTLREKKMIRWVITDEKRAKEAEKMKNKTDAQKTKEVKVKKTGSKDKADKKGKKDEENRSDKKEREEYSPEELMKKIGEIAQQRGRRGFDRAKYISALETLRPHAQKQGSRALLCIYSALVSADFDNTGGAFAPMRTDLWVGAMEKVTSMLPLLIEYFGELKASGLTAEQIASDNSDGEDQASFPRQQELFVAFVEKLDDELYKALQFCSDVYAAEYTEILGNSSKFMVLLKRVIKLFEEIQQAQPLGALSLRLMEHLYYKHDVLNSCVFEAISHGVPDEEKGDWAWPADSKAFMAQLCRNVRATDRTDNVRRACFCQVYHLALHDHYQAARDLLHLGNLTEQAETSADVKTQILNNRVVAQMGLCAFRLGKIHEAHQCLMAVCMHNKARELLAQGLSYSKNMDRTPEQERAERLRLLPYHMHINLEVLDSAHHVCAMLLEIPNLAMQSIDPTNKTRVISRVLRRHLEAHDKQLFIGPPENAKEAVVSAAKSLQRGEWQGACAALEDLKIWDHVDAGSPEAGQKVKEMIKEKVKIEALRTYLFAYASIYDAFHLDQLVGMFELDSKLVHSIVSKMMIREELAAFWDESSQYVLVQHSEPTHLQRLALALADRGAQAVDNNERLVDQKGGGSGFKDQRMQAQGGRFDQPGQAVGARGRFGKGSLAGRDKGKGKGGKRGLDTAPARNRGWENARAGALRGTAQRGWSAAKPN
eukprot:TRINITY_DN72043_c0_g1_i1.p1 TRINITY_DN72043_c0_g1~~TRINITY_DN72043_c0_g1_i1.p1  ORF type:complete len:1013 (+),score=245.87 TRINITY_DN72043_c0_g1_i1:98-3040(+)